MNLTIGLTRVGFLLLVLETACASKPPLSAIFKNAVQGPYKMLCYVIDCFGFGSVCFLSLAFVVYILWIIFPYTMQTRQM